MECVNRNAPNLLPLLENNAHLKISDIENLRNNVVYDELMERGFNKNWEVNAHGQRCEDLIDSLGNIIYQE